MKDKKCPHCGGPLGDRPALSRRDSIDICADCGYKEAIEDIERTFGIPIKGGKNSGN